MTTISKKQDDGSIFNLKRLITRKAAKLTEAEVRELREHGDEALPALLKRHRTISKIRNIAVGAVLIGVYALPLLGAAAGGIYALVAGVHTFFSGAMAGGIMAAMAAAPAWVPGIIADGWTAHRGAETEAKINFLKGEDPKFSSLNPWTSLRDFDMDKEVKLRGGILKAKFGGVADRPEKTETPAAVSAPAPRSAFVAG